MQVPLFSFHFLSFRCFSFRRVFSPGLACLGAAALLAAPSAGWAQGTALPNSLPRVAHAAVVGGVDPGETVPVMLTLPLRDPAGLDALIQRQNTPGSPDFQRFLTPAEFADRFGPTQADYDAAALWAQSQGLTVTATHRNRLLLEVSGPAQAAQAAFGVRLQRVQLPASGGRAARIARVPNSAPTVPAALAGRISGVVGLDTVAVRRPHLRRANLTASAGTGAGGGLSVSDIRTAYGFNSFGGTGAGQTIAIFQLATFAQSDITAFQDASGLPHVPVNVVTVGTGIKPSDNTSTNQAESTLDTEMALALTPNLSSVQVYECPNTDAGVLAGYSRIANDNTAAQVSTSWGLPETSLTSATLNSEYAIFKQMAAQGQAVLSASGDNGAYDDPYQPNQLKVDDPASQPYVTGVGGTTLTTQSPGGSYVSETTWYNASDSAAGGGVSALWGVPDYQQAVTGIPNGRTVPDVSLNSDPYSGYSIYFQGSWYVYGGTSAAAPLWASLTALINSRRTALGLGRVGFLNTPVYQIARSNQAANFHDIADGSSNGYYTAAAGYDPATGWGTPTVTLLNSLAAYGQAATPAPAATAHLGWISTNGLLSLWNLDSANNFTFHNFGPFAGWTARAMADDRTGKTRILWTSTSGQMSLWSLSSATGTYTHAEYGPFANYAATALAVGADGSPRILWTRTDGLVSLWKVDTAGNYTFTNYGPYAGYKATALAAGSDSRPRILWNRTDGLASLWSVDAAGNYTFTNYGPYSGYTASALTVGADNSPRILWTRTDGLVSLWKVDTAGNYTFTNYGPYPGYTASALATGSDSRPRLLWNRSDGLASLWSVDTAGGYTFTNFGPYSGYTAKLLSAP